MCFFIYGGRDQTCPEVHPGTAFRARPDNTSAHARQRSGPGPPGSVDEAMSWYSWSLIWGVFLKYKMGDPGPKFSSKSICH